MWVVHNGGECPIDPKTEIIVKFREGREAGPAPAGNWRWKLWSVGETEWDIAAWRLA